ncbi:hypothetical protein [Pseudomonas gingeri]|uniref:hypothetical protein n=1 Tax=Pseudomonas gingeri TaxID=117681 RepID=UPI0015A270F8|nr:hypothetical protein [Pseudomonas gingeri]NWE47163.1 hypothetical protein [Pseudomonas gingeri]
MKQHNCDDRYSTQAVDILSIGERAHQPEKPVQMENTVTSSVAAFFNPALADQKPPFCPDVHYGQRVVRRSGTAIVPCQTRPAKKSAPSGRFFLI